MCCYDLYSAHMWQSWVFPGRYLALCSLSYFIIQGPAFAYDCGVGTHCHHTHQQHWFALAGILTCLAAFVGYLVYQVRCTPVSGALSLLHLAADLPTCLTVSGQDTGCARAP